VSDVEFLPQAPPVDELPAPPEAGQLAPAPAPPRRRLWLRSLQSRLVAGVVALVLLLVLAIGAATFYSLRSFLLQRLDQQLQPIAATNAERLTDCLAQVGPGECSIGPGPGGYRAVSAEWIMVLNAQGRPAISISQPSGLLREMTLSGSQRKQLLAHPPDAETVTTSDGTELRISARASEINGEPFVIISGLPTGELHKTLRRLLAIEVIIGGSAVLLAFVITSLGVRRSLRNLYAVTGTAREVAAELSPTGSGLERRVPVVEEGTEVGQLAESMNTLLAAVETQFGARLESEQRMRQFLADASHELRTPLTSIRGYAELARMQRAAGSEPEETGDNLHRIESEGTRMSRLVDDLLLLARGDADDAALQMHRELVDVGEVLDDAVSGARAAFPERPISLEVAPVPGVLGDHDQLVRAVRNLVTNAAVHTEAGRPIAVRAFTDAGGAVITVADGGPGLPAEQAAHVFERFWRADKARTRARGGSGLGLSIVATIVRQHGGSVGFDSSVDTGSTATVWLPAVD
jgi:two-component system, OmpR family, sensor kinase